MKHNETIESLRVLELQQSLDDLEPMEPIVIDPIGKIFNEWFFWSVYNLVNDEIQLERWETDGGK